MIAAIAGSGASSLYGRVYLQRGKAGLLDRKKGTFYYIVVLS